ncbi:sensor histidine kinase [Streptomyces sp. NPDC004111]|uniref:sensor histidine kinase n=1 Tax=Streptomyces sp. NPDC004111 TaxID=3364690 RepID=UPI0036A50231
MGGAKAMGRTKQLVGAGARQARADLLTLRANPMPRMQDGWPPLMPHVLVAAFAVGVFFGSVNSLHYGFGIDRDLAVLLSAGLTVPLAAALAWPAVCWWIVSAGVVAGAWLADDAYVSIMGPWSSAGVLGQAMAVFLLALRVRLASVAVALVVTAGAALAVSRPEQLHAAPLTVLAVAALAGGAQRRARLARSLLAEQEGLTAEERARRTLLEERSRIARELHDVVAHHMSVISIQAQVAPHLAENPSPELRENLAGIRQNAVEALTELRRVLGVLRSAEPDTGDGVRGAGQSPQPTLDRLGDLFAGVRAAGLDVAAETTGTRGRLSPGVELSAYRIVQEALSNAMRHAPGAAVRVTVAHHTAALTLRVVNTAPARPVAPSPGAGHGLLGMRERVAMLGGELATGPLRDGGYEVVATLPLTAEPHTDPQGSTRT